MNIRAGDRRHPKALPYRCYLSILAGSKGFAAPGLPGQWASIPDEGGVSIHIQMLFFTNKMEEDIHQFGVEKNSGVFTQIVNDFCARAFLSVGLSLRRASHTSTMAKRRAASGMFSPLSREGIPIHPSVHGDKREYPARVEVGDG